MHPLGEPFLIAVRLVVMAGLVVPVLVAGGIGPMTVGGHAHPQRPFSNVWNDRIAERRHPQPARQADHHDQ
ncbi:MAG TPA: hypothetical protein ENN81_07310 [Phycisphaerales bacterium]|nr:hypothetical protein [Phycisphaerales bacterium]